MFYLVLQIWFCLLLAAALGAFLMWLVRAWSKEEKASDLVVNWEERLAVARTENHQINSQLQAASAKISLLPSLQAELDRKQQEVAELSGRHESAEAAWTKKYSELEAGAQEIRTSLEDQLAQLRGEFAGLANQRESLAARLDESLRTGAALEREVADAKSQVHEWSTRFAELETASHESRIRLSAVTSECDRLREAATASAARAQDLDDFRRELTTAQQEVAGLRADLAKAHDTENQWREKWHEAEDRCEHVQAELAALTARFQQLGEVENEKSRWQSESAAFSQQIAQLDAESAQTKKRLAELGSENDRLRAELQATADRRDPAARRRAAPAPGCGGTRNGESKIPFGHSQLSARRVAHEMARHRSEIRSRAGAARRSNPALRFAIRSGSREY